MINFLNNLALLWVKNAIFSPIFWRKVLKIITSVHGHPVSRYRFSAFVFFGGNANDSGVMHGQTC
jgi:hypothetical protein